MRITSANCPMLPHAKPDIPVRGDIRNPHDVSPEGRVRWPQGRQGPLPKAHPDKQRCEIAAPKATKARWGKAGG